ncbi:MAG: uracil-DNA glycosylase [Anaerolineales bacterium]
MPDINDQLQKIAQEIHDFDDSPLTAYREENDYQPVPGEGNPKSRVLLLGEAPGKKEAETGKPFMGSGGKVLNELLESIGLSRKDVFITNLLKDRPPENRDPKAAEIEAYAPFLWKQIEVIQPKLIVTLGRFAMHFILDAFHHPQKDKKISDIHGQLLQGKADYGDVYILPLYHPAAALYNRSLEPALKQDIQVLKVFLEKPSRK